MWAFIASFLYWLIAVAGISSLAFLLACIFMKGATRLDEEAEEEDRITRELIEAMDADLFVDLDEYGALEGAHGRKA